MPEDYYPDDGENDEPTRSKSKSRSSEDDPRTELVSKRLLSLDEDEEVKEGKVCKFRVVKDWGDSVELEYVSKSKTESEPTNDEEKDEEDSDDDAEEPSANDEIDQIEAASLKG